MLTFGSVLPGLAFAGEVDSEGVGTAPEVEVPVAPDLDPEGEETGLEEVPTSGGGEDEGAVEVEVELNTEAPASTEVTSAATGVVPEVEPPQPAVVPEVATAAPELESVEQEAPEFPASEPVANQSIAAPKWERVERHVANEHAPPVEAPPLSEPAEEETPPPRHFVAPVDPGRNLTGKGFYVVREGDCLSHIAEALLPPAADTTEIELEVERLWRLNADRIGTGDPDLIYPGTVLRLR
jgi:nucleoid-associated protein YgaU